MQRFTQLIVWQASHTIALRIYEITRAFPPDERYGLVSQLRRAAVSVSANIAEGAKRLTARDYAHFLNIAEGSVAELECLLALARDLGYVSSAVAEELAAELERLSKMLYRLRTRLVGRSAVNR